MRLNDDGAARTGGGAVAIDWDRLEREFAGEPELSGPARRRVPWPRHDGRATAVLALGAVVVVIGLVVAMARLLSPAAGDSGAADAVRRSTSPAAGTGYSRGGPAARRAAIYAAALGGGAGQELRRPVFVRTAICASVPATPGDGTCVDGRISRAVQRRVRTLLGPRVHFAAQPAAPRRPTDPAVVQFGRLRVRGYIAELGIETLCGPLCGEGERLRLRVHDGRWQVSATIGPRWVS